MPSKEISSAYKVSSNTFAISDPIDRIFKSVFTQFLLACNEAAPTLQYKKSENEALFLRLGLPSTQIRHENAALFLRLGLPSTQIRHENGAF